MLNVNYIESANMRKNPDAIIDVMKAINDHCLYAEINGKMISVKLADLQKSSSSTMTEIGSVLCVDVPTHPSYTILAEFVDISKSAM